MSIQVEIAKLQHDAEIELFILDASKTDGGVYRFHGGTNELNGPVIWQNEAYKPRQIRLSGFNEEEGQRPQPTLTLSNVSGAFGNPEIDYNALEGARLIRVVTLARYLDPINFPKSENLTAGSEELPREMFIIKRKSKEDFLEVEFDLGTPDDAINRKVPARPITRRCWAIYRDISTGCDWQPNGNYYNLDNERVDNEEDDQCPHTIEGCEARFGQGNPIPFMGSPAVGLIQQ